MAVKKTELQELFKKGMFDVKKDSDKKTPEKEGEVEDKKDTKPESKKDKKEDKAEDKKDKKDGKLKEDTEASSTIHPNSMPGDTSMPKSVAFDKIAAAMNLLDKSEVDDFYNKVMAQFNTNFGASDDDAEHAKNVASVKTYTGGKAAPAPMTKLVAKEDVLAMFAGETLTEEFKTKAHVIFEAALNAAINEETIKMEEKYDVMVTEAIVEYSETLNKNLEAYLDFAAQSYIKENVFAIESILKSELTEEFLQSLKVVFNEHYIDIPEEKINVIETLTDKATDLETKLDESIQLNSNLKNEIDRLKKSNIIEKFTNTLPATKQDKFKSLVETIDFNDEDNFTTKINIIKESIFKDNISKVSNINEEVLNENENLGVVVKNNNYTKAFDSIFKNK